MKPEELRIGNYILNPKNKIIQVEEIGSYESPLTLFIDMYKPIPITEKWLIKFGFEFIEQKWINEYITIVLFADGYYYLTFNLKQVGCKLEYIHQLQNIYFALTGKELKS